MVISQCSRDSNRARYLVVGLIGVSYKMSAFFPPSLILFRFAFGVES